MLGVCYYPEHWSEEYWARDARRMRALGLSYVRIGEFAWGRIEKSEGVFDWAWMDRAINLADNPESNWTPHGAQLIIGVAVWR
ncbi:beta-galactosidase [Sphingorhabdus sp. EL138]|uniref:beta-galactosidase n=1 Tax=Sphingorhabdus sp. EL138 TaxID=2073156 RepID=UPI0025EA8ED3|nr:beta-galactosidase [Sphingorhabdus sp. EL138]